MLAFPTLATYLYTMKRISIDPTRNHPPARDLPLQTSAPVQLPPAKATKLTPSKSGEENATLFFMGTATTIMCVHISKFVSVY